MAKRSDIHWSSASNLFFYEAMPIGTLEHVAKCKGLAQGEDLEIASAVFASRLSRAGARLLEIGTGAGRVVSWVASRFPYVSITGIEYSPKAAARVRERFQSEPRIHILEQDVLRLSLDQPVDVALWMWSGFTELHPQERARALQRVRAVLNREGLLVIDAPEEVRGYGAVAEHDDGLRIVHEPYGTLHTQLPSHEQMSELASATGFARVEKMPYLTATGIRRALYAFFVY